VALSASNVRRELIEAVRGGPTIMLPSGAGPSVVVP